MDTQLSNVQAIKMVFEQGIYGRKVEMSELKAMTNEERADLADLCREIL